MPVDKNVKQRHQQLDELFRTPEGLSYAQIGKALDEKGLRVSIRTIQKDIISFETDYGAKFRKGLRRGHSTLVRYKDITKSALVRSDIADKLAGIAQNIQENNYIYPHFVLASSIIQHLSDGNSIDDFYDAVDFGSNDYLTGIELFGDILKAIVNRQCISFEYTPYGKEPMEITVSPYRLMQHNQRWFLICKTIGQSLYFIDALDRITSDISVSDARFEEADKTRLQGFDDTIGTYDAMDTDKTPEEVLLKVKKEFYPFIESKPFHKSQELFEEGDDYCIIRLYVKHNRELESTILYYGDDIEVLQPDALRRNISLKISSMAATYAKTTN